MGKGQQRWRSEGRKRGVDEVREIFLPE